MDRRTGGQVDRWTGSGPGRLCSGIGIARVLAAAVVGSTKDSPVVTEAVAGAKFQGQASQAAKSGGNAI